MNHLVFGEFTLDPHLRQLRRNGNVLPVSGKAFDLLAYMAANPGRPLLKAELLEAIWPGSFVEDSNLSQQVFVLRKALGEANETVILTLPGRGYQFAANVVSQPAALASAPLANTLPTALEATRSRIVYEETTEEHIPFLRSPVALAVVAVAVATAAVAAWLGWKRYEDRVGGAPVQIVMADLDGGTGDSALDRTLTTITRAELAQSPFVSLLPLSTVRATLQQMMLKPTAPITAATARDICERTASQAVLLHSVVHAGKHYLLTEEATNCADGASLATAHEEVDRIDDLPRAITRAGSTIRHGLGESRRTIARFNAPLSPVATQSMEALKNYSQAVDLSQQGHFAESIGLLKQAVALDPNFAAAWLDLANFAANTMDEAGSRASLQKAYDLRDFATEPTRLYIVARYQTTISGDLYEALRDYQEWAALYPRQPQPWSGLANVNRQLGRPEDERNAAQHLLHLMPSNLIAYQSLATAQIHAGDFTAARHTCEAALAHHFDSDSIHYLLLRLAHLQHDEGALAAEEAWGKAHPDAPIFLANQTQYALAEGRIHAAQQLAEATARAFATQGNPAAGSSFLQQSAAAYAELEEPALARKALSAGPVSPTFQNLLTQIDLGESAAAAAQLQQQLSTHPNDTLWQSDYQLLIQAAIALAAGHPKQAVAILESNTTFDHADAINLYLRAQAHLANNQLPQAESDLRSLLAHPEIEPTAVEIPLAQLRLAQTLARESKLTEAAQAYTVFLQQWSSADPAQPLLLKAKQQLLALKK
jgi:DNA-binding winged helix-turn-helix (wHTH) protein/Flp pilus assembly protein TadD